MSDFNQILFANHKPTPLFLARWKAKGGLRPMLPGLTLTKDDNTATDLFLQLWATAFPTRGNLPDDPLHEDDGTITVAFHQVWH